MELPFLHDTSKVTTITLDDRTVMLKVSDGATCEVPEDFHAETDHVMITTDSHHLLRVDNMIDVDTFDTLYKLFRITELVLKFT